MIPASRRIFSTVSPKRQSQQYGFWPRLCLPTLPRVPWHATASTPPFDQGHPPTGGTVEGRYFLRPSERHVSYPRWSHTVCVAFSPSDSCRVIKLVGEGRGEDSAAYMVLRSTGSIVARMCKQTWLRWFYCAAPRLRNETLGRLEKKKLDAPTHASILGFQHEWGYLHWSS